MQCCHSAVYGGAVTCDYGGTGCTNCTVSNLFSQTNGYDQTVRRDKDYTWYWDGNATLMGYNGIKGTVVVRGNLQVPNDKDDRYCKTTTTSNDSNCTVPVPPNAWREYQKYDTSAINEYPGDIGRSSNAVSYKLGTNEPGTKYYPTWDASHQYYDKGELWNMISGSSGLGADLGFYGFLYVGGDFTRDGPSDIYGSMWVEGDVAGAGNTMVFYNSRLRVPTLNVVLEKDSWKETAPSTQAWP
jgi:hypothetical protein